MSVVRYYYYYWHYFCRYFLSFDLFITSTWHHHLHLITSCSLTKGWFESSLMLFTVSDVMLWDIFSLSLHIYPFVFQVVRCDMLLLLTRLALDGERWNTVIFFPSFTYHIQVNRKEATEYEIKWWRLLLFLLRMWRIFFKKTTSWMLHVSLNVRWLLCDRCVVTAKLLYYAFLLFSLLFSVLLFSSCLRLKWKRSWSKRTPVILVRWSHKELCKAEARKGGNQRMWRHTMFLQERNVLFFTFPTFPSFWLVCVSVMVSSLEPQSWTYEATHSVFTCGILTFKLTITHGLHHTGT